MDAPARPNRPDSRTPPQQSNLTWTKHEQAIEQTIDFHTRRVAWNSALQAVDDDDLRQELRLALWQSLPRFDPIRGTLATFLDRVAANVVLSLIRHETAQCRDCRRHGPSLDAPEWEPRRGLAAGDIPDQQRSYSPSAMLTDVRHRRELAEEMRTWVTHLPDPLRQVADLLSRHRQSKIIDLLGLSPRKLRDQIERLRRLYEARSVGGIRRQIPENRDVGANPGVCDIHGGIPTSPEGECLHD